MRDPAVRLEVERRYLELLPKLDDYVSRWAALRPDAVALVDHGAGRALTWGRFEAAVEAKATCLLARGLDRGDVVASSLPFDSDHVVLEFACLRLGLPFAPLDLRQSAAEVLEAFARLSPKAWFFSDQGGQGDLLAVAEQVLREARGLRHAVQRPGGHRGLLEGAVGEDALMGGSGWRRIVARLSGWQERARRQVGTRDPALVLFTTGSTGAPKGVVLCHQNVLAQTVGLTTAFGLGEADRVLVNLPASTVGGQTEQLMSAVFAGATAILVPAFDAAASLDAIQAHGVTVCGQIPALYEAQWRLPDYPSRDLSRLRLALYGGQGIGRAFLDRLRVMAPCLGTGLGLTETSGLATYTPLHWGPQELEDSLGYASPLCPVSIRDPLRADGAAGEARSEGVMGEVCFRGPQIFLGYHGDPEATRRSLSSDGWCYTGDLGCYDGDGLHYAGRDRFIIRPNGYRVLPGEVEAYIVGAFPERVARAGCVGVKHPTRGEAIMAFVEVAQGTDLGREELDAALAGLVAYKRPAHVVFLRHGGLPLDRSGRTDALALGALALAEVARLEAAGTWGAPGRSEGEQPVRRP